MRTCMSANALRSARQWTCVHGWFSNDATDFVLFDRMGNPSDSSSQYEQRVFAIHAKTPREVDVSQCKVGLESFGIVDDGNGALKFSEVGIVGENLVQTLKHRPRARVATLV